jgi:tetratricopeptide (TPR) repeat protein
MMIFFVFINFVVYYITSIVYSRDVPETKQLMFSLFLMIPLALTGVEKFISKINYKVVKNFGQDKLFHGSLDLSRKKIIRLFLRVSPFLLMVLIISPVIFEMAAGINFLNNYYNEYYESSAIKKTNEWLRVNATQQEVVASNYPQATFLRTGMNSIPLPSDDVNQNDFENFIDNYNVIYVVFYDVDKLGSQGLYDKIKGWPQASYNYEEIFSVNGSHIVKSNNLIDSADISKPVLYVIKASKFERLGSESAATQIYNEIMNHHPILVDEQLCEGLKQVKNYDFAIKKCNQILNVDATNLVALHDLGYAYGATNQTEKTFDILNKYNVLISEGANNTVSDSWTDLMNFLLPRNDHYKMVLTPLLSQASAFEESGQLDKALSIYKITKNVNEFKADTLTSQIRIYTKTKDYDNAISTYDELINTYEKTLGTTGSKTYSVQKSLMDASLAKADFLTNIGRYDDADQVYLDIIRLDMFNKDAHEKRAELLQKMGDLAGAQQEFDFVKRLIQASTKL